jgi:hypothetical protein
MRDHLQINEGVISDAWKSSLHCACSSVGRDAFAEIETDGTGTTGGCHPGFSKNPNTTAGTSTRISIIITVSTY